MRPSALRHLIQYLDPVGLSLFTKHVDCHHQTCRRDPRNRLLRAKLALPSLPWAACFALGAIVAPPDAVSAKAILQNLPIPPRIVTILEGESLVNDAASLMLYRIAVAAVLTGTFSWQTAVVTFTVLSVGGILVGAAIGLAASQVFSRMRDAASIILRSFLVSWGAYIGAEALHVSGVLAVATAGLVLGWDQHKFLSASSRLQARVVWEIVVFAMEAMVFILLGLALKSIIGGFAARGVSLVSTLPFVLAVTACVVVSRFAWVLPATYLPRMLSRSLRLRDPPPAMATPIVVSWAGMRGVVSLAAALELPAGFPERDLIVLTTFVAIAVTVLVQGLSLAPLVRWFEPREHDCRGMTALLTARVARAKVYEAASASVEAEARDTMSDSYTQMLIAHYRN